MTFFRLNAPAWNNKGWTVGSFFLLAFKTRKRAMQSGNLRAVPSSPFLRVRRGGRVFPSLPRINRSHRGDTYCCASGEILRPQQDEQLRKHFSRMFSLIKNESVGIEDDQIPS